MPIPLPLRAATTTFPQSLPADITHHVAAHAGKFIAAALFDEAETAAGAGAFESCGAGRFDCRAQGEAGGFVAGVRVEPGFGAAEAGGAEAGGGGTSEADGEVAEASKAGEGLGEEEAGWGEVGAEEEEGEVCVEGKEGEEDGGEDEGEEEVERVVGVEAEGGGVGGEVEGVEFGVGAEGAADEGNLGFEEGFVCETGFEFSPERSATAVLFYGAVDKTLRHVAGAAVLEHRGEALDLAVFVVDVLAPALAEERFVDGMSKAAETDDMAVCGACGHLLERSVGKAAFALVQCFKLFSLLFVQLHCYL